jgi:beta-glucosidase
MARSTRFSVAFCGALIFGAQASGLALEASPSSPRVEGLLARMTIEEKVGQLNLLSGHHAVTGPYATPDVESAVLKGEVGGLFNVYGAEYTRGLQLMSMRRSRLGIPLLLGFDVLHGYRTIFPIPLAQAATWDMDAIEAAERVSAIEASAAGVNWIYAPMLDLSRDPRWGRTAEGAGESAWLASRIAQARVRGLQGPNLAAKDSVAACAKHFAGNGATEGGRDYTGADLSERALRETHLPPFRGAVEAGVPCLMAAFNAVDGVPGVMNRWLLTDVLRGEWAFKGVVVSDFGAIEELSVHGVSQNREGSAQLALAAGTDIDMQSTAFSNELPALVRSGKVDTALLDRAVRRVLTLKEDLGLFDDPLGRSDPARETAMVGREEHRATALSVAEKSAVLLKNDGVLPFDRARIKRVAVIGPLADSQADTLGPWAANGAPAETVTLLSGIRQVAGRTTAVLHARGGGIDSAQPSDIAEAVVAAGLADVVVLALGERATHSGEAASRASLDVPGDQLALARAVLAVGKPTAVVLFNGRPLTLTELDRAAPAILEGWFPGSMGGLALARILFGEAEPTGRLPMTFPRSVGQIPIYHDQRPTGRPPAEVEKPYTSSYIDQSPRPLYPFGYGLTYTSFSYSAPWIDRPSIGPGEHATVFVSISNTGSRRGTAMAQLYLRKRVASVSRPGRELRGFARVTLDPGETATVAMALSGDHIADWQGGSSFGVSDSRVDVMTGPDAMRTQTTSIEVRAR